jgi:hypothetical protein
MAEHSSKLSRRLLEAADLFVLDEQSQPRLGKNTARKASPERESSLSDLQLERVRG